jgi:phage tail-like protein
VKLTPGVPVPLTHLALIKIGPFDLIFKQIPRTMEEPAAVPAAPSPVAVQVEPVAEPKLAADAVRLAAGPAPPVAPPPPLPPPQAGPEHEDLIPPGLALRSLRLLNYLPGIYHTDFMARFLGIFESILTPIEWNVDNFDIYLNPGSSPAGFLHWLGSWFEIVFDSSWSEAQRRSFLAEAHQIYARRGTSWAMSRILEIYTGHRPEIRDQGEDQEPFTFTISLPVRAETLDRDALERLIDAHKPTHTTYSLESGL